MQYDVRIGKTSTFAGEQIDIDALEITLDKTEELDFGVLVIPATTRFENYQILERLDVTANDGTNEIVFDPFVIIADKVEPISRLGYYKHTITFIENIHKFEKILSSNIFDTQPKTGTKKTLLDVLARIRNIVPFERASLHEASRLFTIDTDLATYLDGITAPQFFFQGKTLREMLNDIASYVNSIARLNDDNTLIFDFYNEILDVIGFDDDIINKTLENQTKNYTTTIDSNIENAIGADEDSRAIITFPTTTTWASLRASNLKLTDSNYKLKVPFAFETVFKVEKLIDVAFPTYTEVATFGDLPIGLDYTALYKTLDTGTYYYRNSHDVPIVKNDIIYNPDEYVIAYVETIEDAGAFGKRITEVLDATELIFTKQQWDTLDVDVVGRLTRSKTTLKVNTMYYVIGENTLSNGNLAGVFDTAKPIQSFNDRLLKLYGYPFELETADSLLNENQQFRIQYAPYFDTNIRLEKDNVTDHPINTQMASNQADRIVSAERLVNNIYGMVQRLGQDEIEITHYKTDFTDLYNLADITDDGFVITKIHYTFFINYVLVKYLLTKNFNRFSNRIALDQENRSFDLPLGSKTTKRNLSYTEYIELGTAYREADSLVTYEGKQVFMTGLTNTRTNSYIQYAGLSSSEMVDVDDGFSIYAKATRFANGNSLNFVWEMPDIITAGDQMVKDSITDENNDTVEVDANKLIRYTDENGELEELNVKFAHTLDDADYTSNNLPIITTPSTVLIGTEDTFKVYKDVAEGLAMNYQLAVVPNYQNVNNFVVGNKAVNNSTFILDLANTDLHIWVSNQVEYKPLDKVTAKGIRLPLSTTYSIGWEYTDVADTDTYQPYLEITDIPDASIYTSWGIADGDGNLYLGVNTGGENLRRVNFNFVNKREGVNYNFSDTPIFKLVAPTVYPTPSTTSISVTWIDNMVSDLFEYGIRNLTTGGDWTDIGTTASLGYNFAGLTSGNQYQVRVRARKDGYWSAYRFVSAYTTKVPDAPTNVYAIQYSPTSIRAYWNDIGNEINYYVQRKTTAQTWSSVYPSISDGEFSAQNTTFYTYSSSINTVYDFRVYAYNTQGYSSPSNEYQAMILTDVLQPLISNESETGFTITMGSYTTATKYWIRYKKASTIDWTEVDNGTSNTKTFSTLQGRVLYDVGYRVEFTVNGITRYSNWVDVQATTLGQTVAPRITVTDVTESSIKFILTNPMEEVLDVRMWYDVNDSTPDTLYYTYVPAGDDTAEITISGLETRLEYYLYAQSKSDDESSSDVVQTQQPIILQPTSIPNAPSSLTITGTGGAFMNISIGGTTGILNEDGFEVEIFTASGYDDANYYADGSYTVPRNATALFFDSPAPPAGTYWARVRTYNTIGKSYWVYATPTTI